MFDGCGCVFRRGSNLLSRWVLRVGPHVWDCVCLGHSFVQGSVSRSGIVVFGGVVGFVGYRLIRLALAFSHGLMRRAMGMFRSWPLWLFAGSSQWMPVWSPPASIALKWVP